MDQKTKDKAQSIVTNIDLLVNSLFGTINELEILNEGLTQENEGFKTVMNELETENNDLKEHIKDLQRYT